MNDNQELAMLYRRLSAGAHAPGDIERFRQLVRDEARSQIAAQLAVAMPDVARRKRERDERRRAAVEAGRRAGEAVGRRWLQSQSAQPPMSAAHRRERDRVLRQQQGRR
jgi:hypothetical protein